MDIIWHGLSGALALKIVNKKSSFGLGFLIGALPDILGGTGPFFYSLISYRTLFWHAPQFLINLYFFVHSLIFCLILLLIFLLFRKPILIIPYFLHIVVDFLTHRSSFNRLFFPIDLKINLEIGINWWENHFIFLGFYLLLGLMYFVLKNKLEKSHHK